MTQGVLQKYKQLVSDGTFQETLLEMYRWGKQNGWDPAAKRIATVTVSQSELSLAALQNGL